VTLTVGSLFSGIGGLDLGLERAEMRVKWQVENNPYCIRVLEKHWPTVKRYGDIKQIKWSEVEPVDLICGGFPCQPVSVAGSRKGDKDDRWLWPKFLRAIREVRPRYALVENVPGLLSTDDGRLARGVFGDLAEIGYDAEWNIVSAQNVGANHRRERVFIVAYTQSLKGNALQIENRCQMFETGMGWVNPGRPSDNETFSQGCEPDWVVYESELGRVANGVPSRVDRLKCLGNAVVPQVAEYIGGAIIRADGGR
jgi:DNA (cytosine-5)-methyltransferase 1